jgi:glucan 1,3-beta-glucosidase
MVDNTKNAFGVAPDKGSLYKPIIEDDTFSPSNSSAPVSSRSIEKRGYWAGDITHGIMVHAPDGYQMFRNVLDFGAVGDGLTDNTAAINRAASWMSATNSEERCGVECGQTSTLGAIVYFPPGNYLISSPIIQYYYTQFIGDANDRPTIIGSREFSGIALIDCDPYIPEGMAPVLPLPHTLSTWFQQGLTQAVYHLRRWGKLVHQSESVLPSDQTHQPQPGEDAVGQ